MPLLDQTTCTRRTRAVRTCFAVLAVTCVGGWFHFTWLAPAPLQANAEAALDQPTSIRLGLPAFAFEEASNQPASAQTERPFASGATAAGVNSRPANSTDSGIVIVPGAFKNSGEMQITPRRSERFPMGNVTNSGRFNNPFSPASVQSDSPKDVPDNPDEFWKSVVNGQATHVNGQLPEDATKRNGNTNPPTQGPTQAQSFLNPPPAVPLQQGNNPANMQSGPSVVPEIPGGSPTGEPIPWNNLPTGNGTQPMPGNSQSGNPMSGYDLPPSGMQEMATGNVASGNSTGPMGAHSIPSNPRPMAVTSGHSFYGAQPGTSGFRATVEKDANQWMSPYSLRAEQADVQQPSDILPNLAAMPAGFQPWWASIVRQPVNSRAATMEVNVSNLLQDALLYSPQIVAIQTEPEVKYRVITQEAARFDWTAFLETTYNDLNDPVGNELTTGNGDDRLLTRKWRFSGGLRRKNKIGGEFKVTQDFGHENQNSQFFIPNNQASSRLELSYRQPLLDGSGRTYNESEIVLARIDANASEDDVVDALQDHLIDVTTAYWTLYRARAEFFQRKKLLISSQDVMNRLQGRAQVDTIPRQILRSQAAVARAKTGIRRTLARVKDAEAQLRLLVNSPAMLNGGPTELLPFEAPVDATELADLRSILQTALFNRADISGAIRQMRGAGVRLGVSQQELLPRLDLLVSGYVADLSGGSDLGTAIEGQYVDNRPGYTVGFEFELPLANRAARARHEQRQWELKRAINIFRATVEKSLTDVEIGQREVETAYAEMTSRYHSMYAANQESNYLKDRFEVLPGAEDSATLLLEDLLDSFERLADEESAFVRSQVEHALALVNLKKQMGILLKSRHDRPAIETAHQQWVQDRLHTHAPVLESGREFDDSLQTSPTAIQSQSTKRELEIRPKVNSNPDFQATTQPPSQDGSKIIRTSHRSYEDLYVPRGEPIPTHQTVWKRSPLNE